MKVTRRGKLIHDNLQGIYNLAPLPVDTHFSNSPCDGCKTTLGGDRHRAIGTAGRKHNSDRIDLVFCADCFGWLFT